MYFRRMPLACAIALLLLTCTSCGVEKLDPNGDGIVSKSELLSAALDFVCGDQAEPETPDDETPASESPDGETPTDEVPDDGTESELISEPGF